MNKKKRILAGLLLVVMALTMLPLTAFAVGKPTFKTTPKETYQCEMNAALTVTASATPASGYQVRYVWVKYSANGTATELETNTTGSFKVPTGSISVTNYGVVAQSYDTNGNRVSDSSTTAAFTVTVQPAAATITTQPEGRTVTPGEEVDLSVVASTADGGDLSYQWYKRAPGGNWTLIGGATSPKYTVKADGTTEFYCNVINTKSGVSRETPSKSATVTVQGKNDLIDRIAITDIDAPITGLAQDKLGKDSGYFTITSIEWSPAAVKYAAGVRYTVTVTVQSDANYIFSTAATTGTINGLQANVSGTSKEMKLSYTFAPTTAGEAPVIDKQPSDLSVNKNSEAKLTVVASSPNAGELTYQWYEIDSNGNGTPIESGTSATFNAPTSTASTKKYFCRIINKRSDTTAAADSNAVTVQVSDYDPIGYNFPFTDVPENAWYYENVKAANIAGLINGKSATQFMPDENMSIAEAIKLAACINQYDADDKKVSLSNGKPWYQTYVDFAKQKGIITKTYSNYDAKISRQEFADIFSRALSEINYTAVNVIAEDAIPDVKSGSTYGAAIYKLYRAGILTGSDAKGTFHPTSNIKRSEVATVVNRMSDSKTRKVFTLQ